MILVEFPKAGSVEVSTDKMYIEYFSHVMHIVSNIVGKVINNKKSTDVLFSGFPAGTVTGAPKIRAIEIIEELESSRRNIYAGSVGYISVMVILTHVLLENCINKK